MYDFFQFILHTLNTLKQNIFFEDLMLKYNTQISLFINWKEKKKKLNNGLWEEDKLNSRRLKEFKFQLDNCIRLTWNDEAWITVQL